MFIFCDTSLAATLAMASIAVDDSVDWLPNDGLHGAKSIETGILDSDRVHESATIAVATPLVVVFNVTVVIVGPDSKLSR